MHCTSVSPEAWPPSLEYNGLSTIGLQKLFLLLTRKLLPKFVRVARAVAGPLTAKGKTSPTISQLMGPKLTCERRQISKALSKCGRAHHFYPHPSSSMAGGNADMVLP